MEKLENWVYGVLVLLGGIILLIFGGIRLIDLLSKTFLYFMFIFFIILMLYGAILIIMGVLIMPLNFRVNRGVSIVISSIGVLIVILSVTVGIIDFFTIFNLFEILSGICLIILGITLFYYKKKLINKRKKERQSLGIVLLIIGLIISASYGLWVIMIMVSYEPEYALPLYPLSVPPFLIGIDLIIYGIYSIKRTNTTQERTTDAVLPILRVIFIFLSILYIIFLFLFPRISLLSL
jgi:hypothetical protein